MVMILRLRRRTAITATIIPIGEEAAGWERSLYAFLAEKERRIGSSMGMQWRLRYT
jgi:hypothetical protein